MSMRIADNPWKAHAIHDDLESALWVLIWVTIHHIKAIRGWFYFGWDALDDCAEMYFVGQRRVQTGRGRKYYIGGQLKNNFLNPRYRHTDANIHNLKWRCQPFDEFLHGFASIFDDIWCLADGFAIKDTNPPLTQTIHRAYDQHAFLSDPENVVRMFDDALERDGWLEHDAVPDLFPIKTHTDWEKYQSVFENHYEERRYILRNVRLIKDQRREERREERLMEQAAREGTVSTYVSEEVSTFQDPSPLVTDYPPIFQREVEAANPPTPSSPPARRSIRLAKHYRSDGAPSPLCGVQRRVKRKRVDDADDAKKDTKDTKDTQVLKKIKTEPESIQL